MSKELAKEWSPEDITKLIEFGEEKRGNKRLTWKDVQLSSKRTEAAIKKKYSNISKHLRKETTTAATPPKKGEGRSKKGEGGSQTGGGRSSTGGGRLNTGGGRLKKCKQEEPMRQHYNVLKGMKDPKSQLKYWFNLQLLEMGTNPVFIIHFINQLRNNYGGNDPGAFLDFIKLNLDNPYGKFLFKDKIDSGDTIIQHLPCSPLFLMSGGDDNIDDKELYRVQPIILSITTVYQLVNMDDNYVSCLEFFIGRYVKHIKEVTLDWKGCNFYGRFSWLINMRLNDSNESLVFRLYDKIPSDSLTIDDNSDFNERLLTHSLLHTPPQLITSWTTPFSTPKKIIPSSAASLSMPPLNDFDSFIRDQDLSTLGVSFEWSSPEFTPTEPTSSTSTIRSVLMELLVDSQIHPESLYDFVNSYLTHIYSTIDDSTFELFCARLNETTGDDDKIQLLDYIRSFGREEHVFQDHFNIRFLKQIADHTKFYTDHLDLAQPLLMNYIRRRDPPPCHYIFILYPHRDWTIHPVTLIM